MSGFGIKLSVLLISKYLTFTLDFIYLYIKLYVKSFYNLHRFFIRCLLASSVVYMKSPISPCAFPSKQSVLSF